VLVGSAAGSAAIGVGHPGIIDTRALAHTGNIPNLPMVVVCPRSLSKQWLNAVHTFSQNGLIIPLVYDTQKPEQRKTFWQDLVHGNQGVLNPYQFGQRVFIVPITVSCCLQDEVQRLTMHVHRLCKRIIATTTSSILSA
jgi:hypothetical protein